MSTLTLDKFNDFIKFAKTKKSNDKKTSLKDFDLFCSKIKDAKQNIFDLRFQEAKELFNSKKASLKISSFELMEHDFRENSHTNILQYLFDYRFSGDLGIKVLKLLLEKINTINSKKISSMIGNCRYFSKREYPINAGRLDLLILDNEAKFVILIENKILSDIITKQDNNYIQEGQDDRHVLRTQLTNYKEYIQKEFRDYLQILILLSYKRQELTDEDFIVLDYNFVNDVILDVDDSDNILSEYRILLKSLLKNKVEKLSGLELGYKIFNVRPSEKVSLCDLNIIQTLFYE